MGRPCDHKGAYEQPAPLQLKVCLQMPQVLESSPSPHHFVSIYNQPLLLHRHLQPNLTAKCVCTAGFGHHCCLPGTLATEPGSAAEDPLTTPSLLCSTSQAPHSCCCGPWWPESETLCPSGNRVATFSCTRHSTSIYPGSQNDLECSHLHVQVFLEIPKPANRKPPTQAYRN